MVPFLICLQSFELVLSPIFCFTEKMQTKSQNVDLRGDEIQMRAVRKGYSMRDYAGAIVVLLVIPLSLTMIYQLALLSVHEFVAFYNVSTCIFVIYKD